jgi:hypothetical protein
VRVLFLLVLCAPVSITARQSYLHITPDGGGDFSGDNWTNACNGFTGNCAPGTIARGYTAFVATGVYTENMVFNVANSGATFINIVKATPTEHGSETGWNAGYGVGSAEFTGDGTDIDLWEVSQGVSYYNFDGKYGAVSDDGGGTETVTADFGFKVSPALITGAGSINCLHIGTKNQSIYVSNLECNGSGQDRLRDGTVWDYDDGPYCISPTEATCGLITQGIYSNNPVPPTVGATQMVDIQLSNLYIHDITGACIIVSGIEDSTVDDVTCVRNRPAVSALGYHGQGVAFNGPPMDSVLVRNSLFKDVTGTAAIAMLGSNNESYTNMTFCGLIVYTTDISSYTFSPAALYGRSATGQASVLAYNNSFYNVSRPNTWNQVDEGGNQNKNSIYVNSVFPVGQLGTTSEYNFYYNNTGAAAPTKEANQQTGVADPFVNAAGANFALSAATNAGVAVPAGCEVDMNGVTRGVDGTIDRGALEFDSSEHPPVRLRIRPPDDVAWQGGEALKFRVSRIGQTFGGLRRAAQGFSPVMRGAGDLEEVGRESTLGRIFRLGHDGHGVPHFGVKTTTYTKAQAITANTTILIRARRASKASSRARSSGLSGSIHSMIGSASYGKSPIDATPAVIP